MAAQFLADVADERSLNRSNVYRKNLLAAMNWGRDNIQGFPQGMQTFEQIKPYTVDTAERYVPPEEGVIKVLQQAHGQDLIMLLTYTIPTPAGEKYSGCHCHVICALVMG